MDPLTITRVEPVSDPCFPDGVERLEYTSGVDGTADWALLLAPGESPGAKSPGGDRHPCTNRWIVKIHGHGSHGDQLWTRPDLRDQWLPAFRDTGFGILSPNLRDNAWMGPRAAADLHALLALVRMRYGAERFVLASGSMGGTSNLVYAALHPEDVSGVVALCPATDMDTYYRWCRGCAQAPPVLHEIADAIESSYGGPPECQAETYLAHSAIEHADRLTMPVMIAHGSADTVIPVDESRRLAARLAGRPTFRYVELPDGHHDAPLPLCAEALGWVLDRIA